MICEESKHRSLAAVCFCSLRLLAWFLPWMGLIDSCIIVAEEKQAQKWPRSRLNANTLFSDCPDTLFLTLNNRKQVRHVVRLTDGESLNSFKDFRKFYCIFECPNMRHSKAEPS